MEFLLATPFTIPIPIFIKNIFVNIISALISFQMKTQGETKNE